MIARPVRAWFAPLRRAYARRGKEGLKLAPCEERYGRAWGLRAGLLWTAQIITQFEEAHMANNEEPILTEPQSQDVAVHVRDYTSFIKMVKWTTIISAVLGFIVVFMIIY